MSNITIFTVVYNDEIIFKYMIDRYRKNFPECHIVVYDNESTDNTKQIALENNCEVIKFDTNNKVDDIKLINLKNNCWKNAKSDFVLICDPDEILDINEEQLMKEESLGTTIIKPEGYDLVNLEDNFDLQNMKFGSRNTMYDKHCLFNKNKIKDINWVAGAHVCKPVGDIKYNTNNYKLYHYRYLSPQFTIDRYKTTADRLSEINLKTGMGKYVLCSAQNIKDEYIARRANATKIIE